MTSTPTPKPVAEGGEGEEVKGEVKENDRSAETEMEKVSESCCTTSSKDGLSTSTSSCDSLQTTTPRTLEKIVPAIGSHKDTPTSCHENSTSDSLGNATKNEEVRVQVSCITSDVMGEVSVKEKAEHLLGNSKEVDNAIGFAAQIEVTTPNNDVEGAQSSSCSPIPNMEVPVPPPSPVESKQRRNTHSREPTPVAMAVAGADLGALKEGKPCGNK